MLNLKQKAKDLKDKGDSDTKTEPSTKVTDFERPGSDDEPEDEPMDTKVDIFEDSKKFVASLEDVESDLSDLGQKFRDDEEFKKSHDSYGDEKDDMDVPLSDRYYNEVEERLSQKTKFTLINMDESERKNLPPAYLESLIEVTTENLKKSTSVIDKQNVHQESISKSIYEVNKFLAENTSLNKEIKEEIKILSKTIANISKK